MTKFSHNSYSTFPSSSHRGFTDRPVICFLSCKHLDILKFIPQKWLTVDQQKTITIQLVVEISEGPMEAWGPLSAQSPMRPHRLQWPKAGPDSAVRVKREFNAILCLRCYWFVLFSFQDKITA